MKSIQWRTALLTLFLSLAFWVPNSEGQPPKIRVLLVTGGHDFEREKFFQLFATNSEITFRAIEHTNMAPFLKPDAAKGYDVLVLYDLWQDITEEMKTDFVALLKNGKGLVVLHHAIGSYQKWPEYRRIIGGRYYLEKDIVDGVEKEPDSFEHGRHFKISVADPHHPVTEGIHDFEIHDETYKGFDHTDDVHPLLTTDDPESSHVIAWRKNYGKSRVVFIQSGHDHFAWDNPNYQRLLRQAIRWTASSVQAGDN